MRGIIGVAIVGGVMALSWRVGGAMSSDAVGMAIGVVFGVMASIPAALLVLAAGRNSGGVTIIDTGQTAIRQERDRALMEAAYWRGVAAGQRLEDERQTTGRIMHADAR